VTDAGSQRLKCRVPRTALPTSAAEPVREQDQADHKCKKQHDDGVLDEAESRTLPKPRHLNTHCHRYHAGPVLHARSEKTSSTVSTIDTTSDPRQPRRLEKRKNTRSPVYSGSYDSGACTIQRVSQTTRMK
jgi:hypothetical protein